MNISSKYTWMNWLMQSQKMAVISCWNVEGALQSPICITWLLNVPSTVANAVLWMCSSTMRICSYTSDILSFDRYATWPYHYEWYPGQGMGSRLWLRYHSVLVNRKQCIVYRFSSVFRALAPLNVPLQVSTTVQWCISQLSERALHGNALGISADWSGYISQDQLDWSCSLRPR